MTSPAVSISYEVFQRELPSYGENGLNIVIITIPLLPTHHPLLLSIHKHSSLVRFNQSSQFFQHSLHNLPAAEENLFGVLSG